MSNDQILTKVPAVTLTFWVIKILATTLGETGSDTVTMTWFGETTTHPNPNGYLIGSAIFLGLLIAQIASKKFHPVLYWGTIIASTTAGTMMADFADRSLGIGYTGGSTLLLCCVLGCLALWYWSQGTVSVDTVNTPKIEAFYWATITFSQTLGTALGDWMADNAGMGFAVGALIFAAALVAIAALYFWTSISRALLFWTAFILTRPLGATIGDFLDKPLDHGGLNLSRPIASIALAVMILTLTLLLPQRAGSRLGNATKAA